jgi:hypothetical protein
MAGNQELVISSLGYEVMAAFARRLNVEGRILPIVIAACQVTGFEVTAAIGTRKAFDAERAILTRRSRSW